MSVASYADALGAIRWRVVVLAFILLPAGLDTVGAASSAPARYAEEWTRPFPPFRMIGNIYWVGGYDLSTYLITTPAGHVLINTGVADTAARIADSVEQLGFRMSDVKILTTTHGHVDHVAGLAALRKMTGAQVIVSAPERALLESGGTTDFRYGQVPAMHFEPVPVDRIFQDGEALQLGGMTLTTHIHPGHTKGATSFTTDIVESGRTYKVVIATLGSINPGVMLAGMPGYPDIAADYAKTFAAQKRMAIDVFLASHASQFKMHDKYTPGDPYDPNRFVDPAGFHSAVDALEREYVNRLAEERAGLPR